jgi:small subunit ribosomal protein S20
MPQRKAGQKDLRKNVRRHGKNLKIQNRVKSTVKQFKKSLTVADTAARATALKAVYKILDRAASKNVIHPNKAARTKSRLTKLLNKTPAAPAVAQ